MAKNDNQMQMPSSQGGLVQYFDSDTGIQLDPKAVVAFTALVAVVEIIAHAGLV